MKRVLAVVAAVACAQPSWAACNVIPDPTTQLVTAPDLQGRAKTLQARVVQEDAAFGDLVRYKGALGRVDRVFLSPLRKDPIRVAADGHCIPDKELPPFDVTRTDDLVAALVVTTASGATAVVASGGEKVPCSAIKASRGHDRLSVDNCTSEAIAPIEKQPNVLELTLPPVASIPDAQAIKLVMFRPTASTQIADTLQRLAATDCAALCGEAASATGLGVCIDKIYTPTKLTATQMLVFAQDMVKCEVFTTIPWNDFADRCQNGAGSSGKPQCKTPPTASTITMWEDDCNGVYIPFQWGALLSTPPSPDKWERHVQGQTAITQKQGHTEPALFIPGAEFVGTLSAADVTGPETGFVTDPRRAQLDVWFPTDKEFGIRGIADKPESIIHVVPRLAVDRLCSGTSEACTGVPTVPSIDDTRCACRDRYAPDCTCTTTTPKYFQCKMSSMPCTRHAHCQPGDLCSAQPTCQKRGTVWSKAGPNPAGPTACWSDDDCSEPTRQCGFLLFDLHDMREPSKRDVIVDAKLGTGPRTRRGVCTLTANPRKICSNASGATGCAAGEGDCAEFVLEALGGTKLP